MLKGPEPLAVAELAPLRLAPVHTRESLKPGKDIKTTPFPVLPTSGSMEPDWRAKLGGFDRICKHPVLLLTGNRVDQTGRIGNAASARSDRRASGPLELDASLAS